MNELITINYETSDRPTVMGRQLHEALEVSTPYHKWFPRMCEYGFTENEDYSTTDKNVLRTDGTPMPQIQHDHQLTIPMAKEICMLQRSEKGKQFRQYFIKVEEAWNSPEMVMGRALKIAQKQLDQIKTENLRLTAKIEADKPKIIFADAVSVANTSILIGELAKILKQNGVDIGQNRLFEYLRTNGYLISRKGSDRNMPTQRAMEMGLFEIKETTISHADGHTTINKTPKVTGKGQQYFINKFLKS
ncbi:MAG: phage antirepressor KilAC domain-containing protein [Ruminococcus sp.]|nr:phage antirepressor KilAC domain-containing protein [Ruminococcus sp.]